MPLDNRATLRYIVTMNSRQAFQGKPGYSADHYRRLANGGPDTQADIEWRRRYAIAGPQAHAEMVERFSPLTPENAQEAILWQEARVKELMK